MDLLKTEKSLRHLSKEEQHLLTLMKQVQENYLQKGTLPREHFLELTQSYREKLTRLEKERAYLKTRITQQEKRISYQSLRALHSILKENIREGYELLQAILEYWKKRPKKPQLQPTSFIPSHHTHEKKHPHTPPRQKRQESFTSEKPQQQFQPPSFKPIPTSVPTPPYEKPTPQTKKPFLSDADRLRAFGFKVKEDTPQQSPPQFPMQPRNQSLSQPQPQSPPPISFKQKPEKDIDLSSLPTTTWNTTSLPQKKKDLISPDVPTNNLSASLPLYTRDKPVSRILTAPISDQHALLPEERKLRETIPRIPLPEKLKVPATEISREKYHHENELFTKVVQEISQISPSQKEEKISFEQTPEEISSSLSLPQKIKINKQDIPKTREEKIRSLKNTYNRDPSALFSKPLQKDLIDQKQKEDHSSTPKYRMHHHDYSREARLRQLKKSY